MVSFYRRHQLELKLKLDNLSQKLYFGISLKENAFRGSIEYGLLYSLSPHMSHAPPIFGLIVDMTYLMSAMVCH